MLKIDLQTVTSWITGEIQLVLGRSPEACHRLIPHSSSVIAFFRRLVPPSMLHICPLATSDNCTPLNVLPDHVLLGNQDAAYRDFVIAHGTNVCLKRAACRT
jgi:hypothetical protein